MNPLPSPPVLPPVMGEVLEEFHRTHGYHAWLWLQRPDGEWRVAAGSAPIDRVEPAGDALVVPTGPDLHARLEVDAPAEKLESFASFLASVVGRLFRYESEARFLGGEIAERYEEITLLYSISEILGSVISLEEATGTILSEVAGTLGVQRATLWLHNPERGELDLVAAVGVAGQQGPVPVTDDDSVTATVFRERRPVILEPADEFPRTSGAPVVLTPRASFLSVPVSYTPPEGESRTIGVINLGGLGSGESFSAGDQKLISAIASQIGAAVENSRLVASSLRQERLVREMELAHDLQLKLLPPLGQFRGLADVAARCVPAESVGGDFYHLFRLAGGRLGVMIGDVSSHGFAAALIMALTMSAAAIHASDEESPGEVLRRVHRTLVTELETTEMYLTLFYAVIDPHNRQITFANAGHSHAFRVTSEGEMTRLGATNPPLGIVDLDSYAEGKAPWIPGEDFLFLFTDGLSDALGLGEVAGERTLLAAVAETRHATLEEILDRVFDMGVANDIPADDRTAVLVRI